MIAKFSTLNFVSLTLHKYIRLLPRGKRFLYYYEKGCVFYPA